MTAPLFSQIIGLGVLTYLTALLVIAGRLRALHGEVWRSLGSFSFANWSIMSSLKLAYFSLLSGEHRRLDDRPLSLGIYGFRVFVIALTFAIVVFELRFQ
jgi:hypothetical protein